MQSGPRRLSATVYHGPTPDIVPADLRGHLVRTSVCGRPDWLLNPPVLSYHPDQITGLRQEYQQWRSTYSTSIDLGTVAMADWVAGQAVEILGRRHPLALLNPGQAWDPAACAAALSRLDDLAGQVRPAHCLAAYDLHRPGAARVWSPVEEVSQADGGWELGVAQGVMSVTCPVHVVDRATGWKIGPDAVELSVLEHPDPVLLPAALGARLVAEVPAASVTLRQVSGSVASAPILMRLPDLLHEAIRLRTHLYLHSAPGSMADFHLR